MSNPNLDSVEATLRSLKEVVDRNHSEAKETSALVQDMERLIAEMKSKSKGGRAEIRIPAPQLIINPVVV